jgi:hypothetical protein
MTEPTQRERSGSRTIRTRPSEVEIVEPWLAGKYDPPMQDWLQLPVGDSCPVDPTHVRWGTRNPCGYLLVRWCKECRAEFRGEVTAHTIASVAEALCGTPRRFARGYLDRPDATGREQEPTP